MAIPVGWTPIAITPEFAKGQDWIATFVPTSTSFTGWPVGTTVVADVYDPSTDLSAPLANWILMFSWSAVINGDNSIYLRGPAAQCDLVPATAPMRVRVTLPNGPGSDHYVWLAGTVVRND